MASIPGNIQAQMRHTKALQQIDRCPRKGCDGDLLFLVGDLDDKNSNQICGGHEGMPIARFQCTKCTVSFIITNPRSFWNDEAIKRAEKTLGNKYWKNRAGKGKEAS